MVEVPPFTAMGRGSSRRRYRENLAGLLGIGNEFAYSNDGAGSPVRLFPTRNPLPRIAVAVS